MIWGLFQEENAHFSPMTTARDLILVRLDLFLIKIDVWFQLRSFLIEDFLSFF